MNTATRFSTEVRRNLCLTSSNLKRHVFLPKSRIHPNDCSQDTGLTTWILNFLSKRPAVAYRDRLDLLSVAPKLGKRANSRYPRQTILSPNSGLWRMQFRTVHGAGGHVHPL